MLCDSMCLAILTVWPITLYLERCYDPIYLNMGWAEVCWLDKREEAMIELRLGEPPRHEAYLSHHALS